MPKTETRYLASAAIQQLYLDPESMPWDHIEREVSIVRRQTTPEHFKFSEADRIEIHLATNVYAEELAWFEAGVPKKAVDDLRGQLLTCTEQLMCIAKQLYPVDRSGPTEPDMRSFEVLGMLHNTSEFNLSNELFQLAYQASKLDHHLKELAPEGGENLTAVEVSRRRPDLLALEAFLRHLLNGVKGKDLVGTARVKAARSTSHAVDAGEPLERELWGIPVGENSKVFLAFVNAVLKTGPKDIGGSEEDAHQNRFARNWNTFEDEHALPEGEAASEMPANKAPDISFDDVRSFTRDQVRDAFRNAKVSDQPAPAPEYYDLDAFWQQVGE
ncbi:hypothetical protein KUV47_09115 [Vannielia litorea]|uniref:hypothetical protein n=1 Tax=Vannielia litorea TaxID=1217970 RepID=UPI001C984763|nr:hypothetical protein [Vannielia litorea]MBY6153370.1 hypothetical protein [Vannielia litorea]